MNKRISFTPRARKDLERLDFKIQCRIVEKLEWFACQSNPFFFAKPVLDSEMGGYRFRIGDYRAIFDLEGDLIIIHAIDHRSRIYEK